MMGAEAFRGDAPVQTASPSRIGEAASDAFDLVAKLAETDPDGHCRDKSHGQPTWFTDIDNLTRGLWPGELTVVTGAPGVGKSSFAANIARNVALQGTRVLFAALGTSATHTAFGMLVAQSSVRMGDMLRGRLSEDDWVKVANASNELSETDLIICDDPGITLEGLCRLAGGMAEGAERMLVVVDEAELVVLSDGSHLYDRPRAAGAVAIRLKRLAREVGAPVLATLACQTVEASAGAKDYERVLGALPPQVAATADSVMHISRQQIANWSAMGRPTSSAKVMLAKHWLCKPSELKLAYAPKLLRFFDYAGGPS